MTRILFLGEPPSAETPSPSPRCRRWVEALLAAGHEVHWWRPGAPEPRAEDSALGPAVRHHVLPLDPASQAAYALALKIAPQAIVVMSLTLTETVCRWPLDTPLWVDLSADLPDPSADLPDLSADLPDLSADKLSGSETDGRLGDLFRRWWRFEPLLDRADRLSASHRSQVEILQALVGWRGRLPGDDPDGSFVRLIEDGSPKEQVQLTDGLLHWVSVPERATVPSLAVAVSDSERRAAALSGELEAIKQSKMWRLWMLTIRLRRDAAGSVRRALGLPFRLVRGSLGAVGGLARRGLSTLYLLLYAGWQSALAAGRRMVRRPRWRHPAGGEPERPPRPPAGWIGARRPRLLIVSPYSIYPAHHGGAVRLYNLIRHLRRRVDVHLLIFDRRGADPVQQVELERICSGVSFHRWEPNFELSRKGLLPPNVNLFTSQRAAQQLRDLVERQRIDVVQLEYTELAGYREVAGVPVIQVEHDIAFRSFWRRRSLGFGRRFPDSRAFGSTFTDYLRLLRFEVRACRAAEQVHTMSRQDGAHLASYLADGTRRIRVVPNAVDTAYYRPPADPAAPRRRDVLLVGNFENLPNLDGFEFFVDQIWPLVRRQLPAVELSVVGAKMPESVRAFDGRDGIRILGEVDDMRPSYHRHRVMVVPLRAGSGTRLKLFEAFASGLPSVSTTLGAEGIDYRPGVHLLIADEPPSFAEAVVRLLRDDELHRSLQRAAMELAEERYDWRLSAEENLRGIYQLLPSEPPTAPAGAGVVAAGEEEDEGGAGEAVEISIVIPTLNGGELFAACLDAISRQQIDRPYEVICVDSGSSAEDLATMERHGVRVHAIAKEDFNHGLTRDLGARLARGEVLVFLNQDAVPGDEHWLRRLTAPLFTSAPPAAVQGGMLEFPPDNGRVRRFFWDSCGQRFYFTRESERWIERYHGIGFSTVNAALQRRVWEQIPFGWAPIMEDKKWQREVVERGHEIVTVAEAVVYHTHDYDLHSLARRCESEGLGWRMLGESYAVEDMLRDMMQGGVYREWWRGLRAGELRKPAEFFFPWLRPFKLYLGNRWSRQVKL